MGIDKQFSSGASGTAAWPAIGDVGRLIEQFEGLDVGAVIEAQRKELEALAEANRQACAGLEDLAARREEILREALAPWQEALRAAGLEAPAAELPGQDVQALHSRFQENLARLHQLLQQG
jgi:hypothetical protein